MPALVKIGSGSPPPGAVRLNQAAKAFISRGMARDGGALKCTLGAWIAPDTTRIASSPVR